MSIDNLLDEYLNPWMSGEGRDGDIVLSTRVRLARNLEGLPFPNRANSEQLSKVIETVRKTVNDLSNADGHRYMFIEMEKLSALERNVLVEKHIVSPNHIQDPEHRALIVRDDAAVSVMVNEEDHLRIQCLSPGLNLAEASRMADVVDDTLEARLDFAFKEEIGYLTACPTNLGTGLRASVMLHLPALVITRQMNRVVNAATQLGLAVRGLYGEGSEAFGNIFQISNQLTLGKSEKEITDNLESVVKQVVDHERTARKLLLEQSLDALSDRVWRAFGILRYARSMGGQEALTLLSEVRLGIDLRIIPEVPAKVFNELLVLTRPNFLHKLAGGTELEPSARDRLRAEIIRDKLKGGKNYA
ncbi:MAG: protein arginine kinase [Negativicutes bacterium]|nr:protein arginine kinase [Negativicutes bacterium]